MGEKFTATCNEHEVVMVTTASFGSMEAGKCISNAHYCQKVSPQMFQLKTCYIKNSILSNKKSNSYTTFIHIDIIFR